MRQRDHPAVPPPPIPPKPAPTGPCELCLTDPCRCAQIDADIDRRLEEDRDHLGRAWRTS